MDHVRLFSEFGEGESGLQGGKQSRAFISNTDKELISNEKEIWVRTAIK